MANRLKISEGTKYGSLIYLKDGEGRHIPSGQFQRTAICKCDCGVEVEVLLLHLTRNRAIHCMGKEKHGDSGKPLHTLWRGMKNRCKPAYFQRKYYFDKGITV